MNMIRQIQYSLAWLLVSMVTFTACQQEELEVGRVQTLPEGSYEVHFYPEQGYGTKSVHDNQPKNIRISSLKYLRYNSVFELQKLVDIPVDETTVWPMRRETMTWEQREALKDTVETESTYYIMFVANWDRGVDEQGNTLSLLQDIDNLEKASIQLPDSPFEDNNMFYLFTDSISSQLTGVDRDHPYNCPVLLQRIVTRQDFWGERLPEWKEEGQLADGEKNPAEEYVHIFSRRLFLQFCFAEQGAFLKERTNASIQAFWEAVKKAFETDKETANETIKKIDASIKKIMDALSGILGIPTLSPEEKAKLEAEKTKLEAEKAQLEAEVKVLEEYIANCEAIIWLVPQGVYYQQLMGFNENKNSTDLDTKFLQQCMANAPLKKVFLNRWVDKFVSLKYNTTPDAPATGANRFYLFNWQSTNGIDESVKMPVDTMMRVSEITYDGFTWVGFGKNLSQGAMASNVINSLAFYNANSPTVVFELKAQECTTHQTGNQHYQAVYTPIESMAYNSEVEKEPDYTGLSHTFTCNLDIFLENPTTQTDFKTAIEELLKDETKEPGKTYGADITSLKLTIQIPDLSSEQALVITPKWRVTSING